MPSNRRSKPLSPTRRGALGRVAVALLTALPWRFATAAHVVRAWPAGRPVPPLDVVDLAGKPWRLEALAGQVVILNFWATWCEPCRLEMPSLDAMAARRRREGVVVAAINYKEAREVIQRFLERSPFKSPVLLDSDGDATVAWTPRVFPSTVIVGRNGLPVHVVVGELDWEGAEAGALLDPLVAAPGRA
ncbi:MAG: TlpA family protein disulfide reductase [Pseudomonadota bacterium]|nr:TlpA family protein disulfide reductase [Pseudomonadota bacterium]